MRVRIVWKFFAAFVLLTIVTVVILSSFLVIRLGDNVESKISQRLQSNTILAGEVFRKAMLEGDSTYIQREAKKLAKNLNLRITVIDKQGKVLADSEKDASVYGEPREQARVY